MAFSFQRLLGNRRRASIIPAFAAAQYMRIATLRTVSTSPWQQYIRQLSCLRTPNKMQSSLLSPSTQVVLQSHRRGLSSKQRHCPFCNYISWSWKRSHRRESISPSDAESRRSLQTCGSALYAGHNKWSMVISPSDAESRRSLQTCGSALFAGHNKWSKVISPSDAESRRSLQTCGSALFAGHNKWSKVISPSDAESRRSLQTCGSALFAGHNKWSKVISPSDAESRRSLQTCGSALYAGHNKWSKVISPSDAESRRSLQTCGSALYAGHNKWSKVISPSDAESRRSLQTCGSALYAGHNKWSKVISPSDAESRRSLQTCGSGLYAGHNKWSRVISPSDAESRRSLQTCGSGLYAGHNKWSKVKHIKGPKDLEKSKVFTRFGIQLKLAVKEGGPNPETNSSLATLISLAKSKAMPKTTIDSIIKKASTSKQGDSQQTFEVRGPANSSLLVTVLTDNAKRTRVELAHLANKNGGVFGEQGTAMFAFEKKGVVQVACESEGEGSLNIDEAEELAIDVGAEEVSDGTHEDDQKHFMFICDPSDLRSVRDGLAARSLQIQSSGLEFIPQTTIGLEDSDLSDVAALINAFESHEEVIKVFDNVISKD